MSIQDEKSKSSRREFLRTAAVTAAASAAVPAVAKSSVYSLAPQRVLGANDRIVIGHVGMGGQGMTHLRLLKENAEANLKNNTSQVAVCDLYNKRTNEAQKALGLTDSQKFSDYRKLLEIKEIDAVWVTTSDNWHAPIAIDAMKAGKHVYIEKPMCKTLEETFALYDTVKSTKRILQVGSQGTSDPKYHAAQKMVAEGKLGTVVQAQGSYNRNGKGGEWNYYEINKDASPTATGENYVNWEVFRKGTEPAAWDPDRYFRWRKYWEYGTGLVGDLLPHRLNPLFIALNIPTTGTDGYPTRVASLGGLYVQKINPETGKMDRNVPDMINLNADFEGGPSLMLMSSCVNEQGWPEMLRGNKATMYIGGDSVEIRPEAVYADDVEGDKIQMPGGEPIEKHERNFLDCIRTNGVPNCNIEIAARVQTVISLGELSFRNGKMMHFDAKTRKAWG